MVAPLLAAGVETALRSAQESGRRRDRNRAARLLNEYTVVSGHVAEGNTAAAEQYMRELQKGKTRRAWIYGGVILGGLGIIAASGLTGLKIIGDALIPKVSVTTQQDIGAALLKVKQREAQLLATGSGTGSATVKTSYSLGNSLAHLPIPGWIAGEQAHVTVPRYENVFSRVGAVTLEGRNVHGAWHTVVLVDPSKISFQPAGNQPPLQDSGASTGAFNKALQLLHVNPNEEANIYQTAESLAVNSFSASSSRQMTDNPEVLAALEANSIRHQLTMVTQDTEGEPRVHRALTQLASNDILVEFVQVDSGSHMTFMEPSSIASVMKFPALPKATSVDAGMATFSFDPEHSAMTAGSVENLDRIASQPGFELLAQPFAIPATVSHRA